MSGKKPSSTNSTPSKAPATYAVSPRSVSSHGSTSSSTSISAMFELLGKLRKLNPAIAKQYFEEVSALEVDFLKKVSDLNGELINDLTKLDKATGRLADVLEEAVELQRELNRPSPKKAKTKRQSDVGLFSTRTTPVVTRSQENRRNSMGGVKSN